MNSRSHRWWLVAVAGCALAIGAGFGMLARAADEEPAGRASRRAARTSASSSSSADGLERKLEEVLAGQQAILKRLDEIMEELKIVKIRASVR
jgi:hypothetical protein